jgi:hypothetical protein
MTNSWDAAWPPDEDELRELSRIEEEQREFFRSGSYRQSTDCGDDTCSSLDTVVEPVPHGKVEADFDRAIGLSCYSRFMKRMEKNWPRTYNFLKAIGLSYRA